MCRKEDKALQDAIIVAWEYTRDDKDLSANLAEFIPRRSQAYIDTNGYKTS